VTEGSYQLSPGKLTTTRIPKSNLTFAFLHGFPLAGRLSIIPFASMEASAPLVVPLQEWTPYAVGPVYVVHGDGLTSKFD